MSAPLLIDPILIAPILIAPIMIGCALVLSAASVWVAVCMFRGGYLFDDDEGLS